jgi:hypothetical protein
MKKPVAKVIRLAGIPLAIAALFYFAYARYSDGMAAVSR